VSDDAIARAQRLVEITLREALNQKVGAPLTEGGVENLKATLQNLVSELPPKGKLKVTNLKLEGDKATFDIVEASDGVE
jgi:hypothetical protein